MTVPDLTLVLNFHREGHLAAVSIAALGDAAADARALGFTVDLVAVLDRPDALTSGVVKGSGVGWAEVLVVDVGDLGGARNAATQQITHGMVGFCDGDDLVGHEWPRRALEFMAHRNDSPILHPEYIYYFDESDFLRHSPTGRPRADARSFFMRQTSSDERDFRAEVIRFNNIYTSNQIAHVDRYREFPFALVDEEKGIGVEDWAWNALTLARGVPHLVVPDSVHLVRVKAAGSLGAKNVDRAVLPDLHQAFPRPLRDGRQV